MRIIPPSPTSIVLLIIMVLFFGCTTEENMEKYAYVVNHNNYSITVIDIEKAVSDLDSPDNAVINTIVLPLSGGEVLKGIAVSPDKRYVYVPAASGISSSLWIIRADGFSISPLIPTGLQSVAVGVAPNGKYAYVLNNLDNTVSVVSTDSRIVVSTVSVGMSPQNIAFSPDGLYAYVTNKMDLTVSVIDAERAVRSPIAAIVSTIQITSDQPKGIAVTPDGAYAYIATAGGTGFGNQVAVVDLETKKEVDTDGDLLNGITPITVDGTPTEGAPRAVAITPDGKYAYVTNLYSNPGGDDTVSVIDTASNIMVKNITVGDCPKGIAITSNGRYALVANAWGSSVSVIDLETDEVITTITHADIQQPNWIAM